MGRKDRAKAYYKLEQMHRHLTEEGKDLMKHMVLDLGLHELDAIELILEQHADVVKPSMKAYLQ